MRKKVMITWVRRSHAPKVRISVRSLARRRPHHGLPAGLMRALVYFVTNAGACGPCAQLGGSTLGPHTSRVGPPGVGPRTTSLSRLLRSVDHPTSQYRVPADVCEAHGVPGGCAGPLTSALGDPKGARCAVMVNVRYGMVRSRWMVVCMCGRRPRTISLPTSHALFTTVRSLYCAPLTTGRRVPVKRWGRTCQRPSPLRGGPPIAM